MKRTIIAMILIGICGLSVCGCSKSSPEDRKILARVSNKFVTLGEFKSRLAKLPSYYKDIVDKNRKRFLDETIIEMMFYEEAIRQRLDQDKEVKDVINEAKRKILIAKLIKTEVEDKVKVEDSEVRQFYETHKDEFKTPELWRASHILVGTEQEANEAVSAINNGASFEDLARAKSTDATASRGGDVGFFRQGQLIPDFENTCAKLDVGQMSGIVHTQFGYHIIKLTDKKEPSVESYEKAKGKIEEELKKKRRSELFDKLVLDLKNKYNVEIEDDVFKSLEVLDADKAAPGKGS
ncbi:MAG: peptidyl-prolyl cis-trans isomerase [Candidatus Omnitrophota bacterium]|jgi:peptidyl-prolyl cis-trans isomerase C